MSFEPCRGLGRWQQLGLALLGAMSLAPTCGSSEVNLDKGATCTRSSQCSSPLECEGGVCVDPTSLDAGRDGSLEDAALDAVSEDADSVVEDTGVPTDASGDRD